MLDEENYNYFGGGKDVFLERKRIHMRGICIYTEERGQISCHIKGLWGASYAEKLDYWDGVSWWNACEYIEVMTGLSRGAPGAATGWGPLTLPLRLL